MSAKIEAECPRISRDELLARHQGLVGAAYEHSLHEVWSAMHRLQK